MSGTIAAMQAVADQLASWSLGYDQDNRWDIKDGGECDCSSSSGWIIKQAGYPIDLGGTFYTGNFAAKAKTEGFTVLPFKMSNVRAGDFLLTPGHHVVFVRDPERWFSAEFDERGKASGGKAGNQNGRETRYRAPYVRPGGWTYIVRPPAEGTAVSASIPLSLRVAWAAQEAPHFGGSKDYAARGLDAGKLGASVVAMSETLITAKGEKPWAMRAAIAKVLGPRWTRSAILNGAVCIFWVKAKYRASTKRVIVFKKGDPWHGALCQPLRRLDSGVGIDFIAVHVRPRDAFTSDAAAVQGKAADLAAALSLVGRWPAVIMGDFAKDADEQMLAAGFERITPDEDSYKASGPQRIDAIYVQPGVLAGVNGQLVDTVISDHRRAVVTIKRAANTNTL